ncbi:MAG: superoxide dismutase [Ni] [Candidatus Omnitrophota bacterium]
MKRFSLFIVFFIFLMSFSARSFPHCQVPCGIYNDEMRFDMMDEDIDTIEKCMKMIKELSEEKDKNFNQIVRWVNTKEHHAEKLSETITSYFLAQRLAPVNKKDKAAYNGYMSKLTLWHELLYYAMKAKQTTDLEYTEKMRTIVEELEPLSLGKA